MKVTELWFIDMNGKRRLFNTITPTSQFSSIQARDLHTVEGRHRAARELRDGWNTNGNLGAGRWEIIEADAPPAVLSKMTNEILARGILHV